MIAALVLAFVVQTAQPVPLSHELELLGWLEGGTWIAHQPGPGGGVDILMRCRWSETRTVLLMDLTYLNGAVRTPFLTAMYVWHPGRRKVLLWQVTQTGAVNEGEAVVLTDGHVEQELRVTEFDGTAHLTRTQFDRTSPNAFRFMASARPNESVDWKSAVTLEFQRQP